MLRLRNRLLPLLHAASSRSFLPTITSPSPLLPLPLSTTTTTTTTTTTPFAVEDYLVATCGLTTAQALTASKKLSHLKSASNPAAVLALLSGAGLSRADLAAVVASDPLLLLSRVDNIAPRLAALRDRLGLSDPQVARFLVAGAVALRSGDVASRLEFLIPFYGDFERLLKVVRSANCVLTTDLEKVIKPNIAQLGECGLGVCDIVWLSLPAPRILAFNPERLKEILRRAAEQLGVPRSSRTFKYAVKIACGFTEEMVEARMEFLRSALGCSMETIRAAVGRIPNIIGLSEETLRRKIEFLVTEVGLEPERILDWPMVLTYSLEKRMMPRHYVVTILRAEELVKKDVDFFNIVRLSEDRFITKYIDCHKDTAPGLAGAYTSACAGEIPAKVHI